MHHIAILSTFTPSATAFDARRLTKRTQSKKQQIKMKTTKIIVVTHYEHIGTVTDGVDLSKKIEKALEDYFSDGWTRVNQINDSK
jgi:hypothetical protein